MKLEVILIISKRETKQDRRHRHKRVVSLKPTRIIIFIMAVYRRASFSKVYNLIILLFCFYFARYLLFIHNLRVLTNGV